MSDTPIQGSITVDKYSHLPIDVQHIVRLLERENAALKEKLSREIHADTTRLEWLLSHKGRTWFFRSIENGEWIASIGDARGFIDTVRKLQA